MSTQVLQPDRLTPEGLDEWLARGWYRIGPTLVTSRFLWSRSEVRSTIWTRLPLHGYRFRRSLRRRMRKVEERFTVSWGPRTLDAEREALYQRYLAVAEGDRSPTLHHFLYGPSADAGLFETREITVREGERLVAFSLFDVGREAVQSLLGVYEPDLASFGLGFYTMLAEIRWALERGFRYHYTGYVLPGEPMRMGYKLEVGDLQFYDPDRGRWRPWDELHDDLLPTTRMRRALEEAELALRRRGMAATTRLYPMFEAPAHHDNLATCLDQPMFLECLPGRGGPTSLAVTWDLDAHVYRLLRCLRAVGQARSASSEEVWEVDLLVVVERLAVRSSAEDLAGEIARHALQARAMRS